MDIEKVKELALANGFKLKEQASGNLDLNAYVYDFANAIEREVRAQAVPEGFVLMPKEPTDEMWSSGIDAYTDAMEDNKALPAASINDIYKAMIEAQEPAND